MAAKAAKTSPNTNAKLALITIEYPPDNMNAQIKALSGQRLSKLISLFKPYILLK